jgi:putative hemolysin
MEVLMKKQLVSLFSFILMNGLLLTACGSPALEPSSSENPPQEGTDVTINEIHTNVMESFPVQVSVTVRGDLADGCVTLNELIPVAIDGGWEIKVDSSRDADAICTEALVPFEQNVPLDVEGLPAGTYTVTLGEQSTSFTLQMDNARPGETDPEPVITLERTPCFGFCPVYTLALYGDGWVVYDGRDFVEMTGEHRENIGVEAVNALAEQFVAAGYLEWDDAYTNRDRTDMPSAITSLTVDGRTKRINHYHGDDSAPQALTMLENLVDETANTAQWIGEPTFGGDADVGLANPASEYCLQQGGRSEIRSDPEGNQYGVCIFEDGSECEEWAFMRGECVPSTDITWQMAVDLIRGGFVKQVFQAHDLTVQLDLKDGRTLKTVEPGIDAVFAVIQECGEPCSDIMLVTE